MTETQVSGLVFWLGVGFIVGCVSVAMTGCDRGGIPIDGEVDPCAIEGVEECCAPCEELDCSVCTDEDCTDRVRAAFAWGYRAGQESVTCSYEFDYERDCNRDVPQGHLRKECRGHASE